MNQPDRSAARRAVDLLLRRPPIAYRVEYARTFGSVTAALFLSQLCYWSGRGRDPEWVYKTRTEWQEETGLSRREQETARRILRDAGVIEEMLERKPFKLYFRVCVDKLVAAIAAGSTATTSPDDPETEPVDPPLSICTDGRADSAPPPKVGRKRTDGRADSAHHTETTENTPENTPDSTIAREATPTMITTLGPEPDPETEPESPVRSSESERAEIVIAGPVKGHCSAAPPPVTGDDVLEAAYDHLSAKIGTPRIYPFSIKFIHQQWYAQASSCIDALPASVDRASVQARLIAEVDDGFAVGPYTCLSQRKIQVMSTIASFASWDTSVAREAAEVGRTGLAKQVEDALTFRAGVNPNLDAVASRLAKLSFLPSDERMMRKAAGQCVISWWHDTPFAAAVTLIGNAIESARSPQSQRSRIPLSTPDIPLAEREQVAEEISDYVTRLSARLDARKRDPLPVTGTISVDDGVATAVGDGDDADESPASLPDGWHELGDDELRVLLHRIEPGMASLAAEKRWGRGQVVQAISSMAY